ncbi:nuclear transport factor 2 family protein [Novosphingobium sp. TH158]|uniref:nuclear transport factor 2 family protein n=1 Tax=Novosphingobium sp. TH158 TaxID=2067455 RepID=UPI000C79D020|nr:nuclear transport factor 2 family protein [Novosphingobium sp. TH158]PLK27088.1 nuclear transport factor 2 family protein [Novosphingobium sp. TH158]
MTGIERLAIAEEVRRVKATYFRGVDTEDGDLVRSILAADCELDYRGCCTDPKSGVDFMPAMNLVLKGREGWVSGAFSKAGITSVHQGHQAEITVTGPDSARAIWAMTDRLYMPPGAFFGLMRGFGFYHETYVREADGWKIRTLRIERLRVEGVSP